MTSLLSTRPGTDEYSRYFAGYVARVPDGNVIDTLARQIVETSALLRALPDSRGDYRYASDKWSIREVIGHMSDTERVFTYRALTFSRADTSPLPGFDQDDYVRQAPFSRISLIELVDEFEHLRWSTLHLFRNLDDDALMRRGSANGNEITVRALAFLCAGHENHHVDILRTRYL
ncbi:MAG: DinB family protein [Gemmatimonadota bacterium]|nr:DinB family protein [Gemmatimonadota bacterium]